MSARLEFRAKNPPDHRNFPTSDNFSLQPRPDPHSSLPEMPVQEVMPGIRPSGIITGTFTPFRLRVWSHMLHF